jgi:hypothetical protein
VEPVNHWRPVTLEYQVELIPRVETRRSRSRSRTRAEAAHAQDEVPLAVTAITWFYFLRGCVYFVLGSVLLSYPSSQPATWLIAHSHLLVPFKVVATDTAPLINLFAETLFILSILSAMIGVMWLMRNVFARWITLCFAGASLARTVLYFVAIGGIAPSILLSVRQAEVLVTGAVVNLLIFGYLAFYPGLETESAPAA